MRNKLYINCMAIIWSISACCQLCACDDVWFVIIEGGDTEAVTTAAGPATGVRRGARPRDAVTNTQQPKLTPFVSVTYSDDVLHIVRYTVKYRYLLNVRCR